MIMENQDNKNTEFVLDLIAVILILVIITICTTLSTALIVTAIYGVKQQIMKLIKVIEDK